MNRHFKWDKKYLYWGITAFCVVACAILFYMALNYMPGVLSAIGSLFSILSPFIWGLAITYILLPACSARSARQYIRRSRRRRSASQERCRCSCRR